MYDVLISTTFAKLFRTLPKATQRRVRIALDALAEDPVTHRPGADIRQLKATTPPKRRLRVGSYRIIYIIDDRRVKVIEIFARERGYSADA
jgi:mRNA-degrading endonuclease RelE of RelBE toxin-antitoxin system